MYEKPQLRSRDGRYISPIKNEILSVCHVLLGEARIDLADHRRIGCRDISHVGIFYIPTDQMTADQPELTRTEQK